MKIKLIVEKPETLRSDLVIMLVYVFDVEMFESLKLIKSGIENEAQVTYGYTEARGMEGEGMVLVSS